MVPVWHFDGVRALRHEGALIPQGEGFVLRFEAQDGVDASEQFVRWDVLTARGLSGGDPVYGHRDVPGWQIGFGSGVPPQIAAQLPKAMRYGGWFDRFGVVRTGAVLAIVSAAVIAIGLKLPDWIAPYIPMSVEQRIGKAMVGDLGGKFCKGPGGEAALTALARRVDPNGDATAIHVVNVPVVNAITLPGGTILIFDGLLQTAKSPDEVAGVLGHERGHVAHRDVMQALVRQLGLSVLFGGFQGNVGGNINALLSTSYSRTAEAAADDYAIGALRRANVSPIGTAAFFTRMSKGEAALGRAGEALSYLSTHPVSSARAQHFTVSLDKAAPYRAALDQAQWQALMSICASDPARKNDKPFDVLM